MKIKCLYVMPQKEIFIQEIKECIEKAKKEDAIVCFPRAGTIFYITKYDTIERFNLLWDYFCQKNIPYKN